MTVREAYINTLRLLKKHKAPAFYVEDFVYLFYNAQVNKFSFLKGLYERNQQLSDDLQPLLGHVLFDLSLDIPYPVNLFYPDGSPYISFITAYPSGINPTINVYPDLNGTLQYQEYRNDYYINWTGIPVGTVTDNYEVSLIGNGNTFDTMIFGDINEGIYLKIKNNISSAINYVRDYRYGGNTMALKYGFDLGFNMSGRTLGITKDKPLYFIWDKDREMWNRVMMESYQRINDNTVSIYAPPEYWYLLDITTHTDVRKSILCENYFSKSYSCKRLTSDTYNGRRNNIYLDTYYSQPYFKEMFDKNVVYPKFEIEYCNPKEKDLVILKKVEVLYLREPRKYYIDDSDLEGEDKTEVLPYPETLCKELVDSTVKLVLESDMDERLQTQPAVNETVIGRMDGVQRK